MEQLAKLIEAIAVALWPLAVIVVLFRFGPAVRSVIESAKVRKFTLKVGGHELSMEEMAEQQRTLIADLQVQVGALRAPPQATVQLEAEAIADATRRRPVVLWVDDNPRNNSYLIQMLTERGIEVDLALSTDDGLKRYQSSGYGAVVSDMGREEGGRYRPDAGVDLLKRIRDRDKDIPFIVYCSTQKAREYRDTALREGATVVTSSPTSVTGAILSAIRKPDA